MSGDTAKNWLRVSLILTVTLIPVLKLSQTFLGIFGMLPRQVGWWAQWILSIAYSADTLIVGAICILQRPEIFRWLGIKLPSRKLLMGIGILLILIGFFELDVLIRRWMDLYYYEI